MLNVRKTTSHQQLNHCSIIFRSYYLT